MTPFFEKSRVSRPAAHSKFRSRLCEVDVDALTRLPHREGLRRHLHTLGRLDRRTTVIVLDLDRFKWVNDSAGFAAGDSVLRSVAERLLALAPAEAFVARLSADEFALAVCDCEDIIPLAEALLEEMRRAFAADGFALTLSASIGIATSNDATNADELLRAAGIAMNRAQQDGRDCCRRFEPWMLESASTRQSLETALRSALSTGGPSARSRLGIEEFEVFYQPQVTVERRQLEGFEALVRWRHPERGLVGPDEFIPIAEATGLIAPLGDWVLRSSCRAAAQWPTLPNGEPPRVAVNVSPLQLRDRAALLASIRSALSETGLPPHQLEIEITESALNRDALGTLRDVKALGVQLALDDFGTGYSSLSQLAQYPFDRLKIDRSFVRELRVAAAGPFAIDGTQQRSHARWMIQAIASLGAGLRLTTVAEGVESEHQAELVRQAGVAVMQGYLISKAIPAADLEGWIARCTTAASTAVQRYA